VAARHEKEQLTEEQAAFLERLKEKRPKVELAQTLALEFFGMTRRREAAGLEDWIKRTAASGIEELRNCGVGLHRDGEAVVAGLTLKWSSGPVEGQVNRLKMIKRQMFGRASLPVLRARIVPAAKAASGPFVLPAAERSRNDLIRGVPAFGERSESGPRRRH
jgi:transposase